MTDTELRMTDHELLALLSMTPTESAETARGLLHLDAHGDNQLLHHAGLTTLLVRGLAAQQGEKIVPVDKGAVVAAVFSQAQEWLEIKLTTPTTSHVLFAVGSNVGALLLSVNPYGIHDVQPIESGPAVLELAVHLASEYLVGAAEGLPATAALRRMRMDVKTNAAQLTAVESGTWELRQDSPVEHIQQTPPGEESMELLRAALNA